MLPLSIYCGQRVEFTARFVRRRKSKLKQT